MSKKTILLVDDSETILLFEKLMLQNEYQIITAKNGRIGLETAIKENPDLIVMDIMMPEMNGIESLQAMREAPETQKTPIIMATTKSEQARVESCYKYGCNDYITKPIDKMELLTKVQKYINGTA